MRRRMDRALWHGDPGHPQMLGRVEALTSDWLNRNWRSRNIPGGGLGGGEFHLALLILLGFLVQFFAALLKLIVGFLHL